MKTVSVVIPAYNEEKRLPPTLQKLGELIESKSFAPFQVTEVIVVDDGSKDQTIAIAGQHGRNLPAFKVVESGRNFGKGHAIHLGMRAATQDFILIADADMSTPWTELNHLASRLEVSQADISIGSRDLKDSQITVRQSWIREHLGKCFNVFVRLSTGLPYKDTQCGFKLFEKTKLQRILPRLKVDNFSWDVEILLEARRDHQKIVEVPVEWAHVDESRVHPVKDGLRMLTTVIKLRIFGLFK